MKHLLILFICFFSIGCRSSHINNNCKEIDTTIRRHITSYYKYDSSDTQSIESIVARWERLSDYLCSKINLNQGFCIVEIAGKEGLLYAKYSKQFYYFKRNGKDVAVRFWKSELKEIQSFILKLVEQPVEYLAEVKKKTKNAAVYDAPNVSILHVDLEDEKQSYFFSMEYSNYIFGPPL